MPTLLLSGFERFGAHTSNPTEWLARDAALCAPVPWRLERIVLPVDWEAGPRRLIEAIGADVAIVVALGLAVGDRLRIERIAVNAASHDTFDNRGESHRCESLIDGAPIAYSSGLPVRSLVSALATADLPVAESLHAGGYLCNATFFHLMHHVATKRPDLTAGFVHVPEEQTMPHEALERAANVVIAEAVRLRGRA